MTEWISVKDRLPYKKQKYLVLIVVHAIPPFISPDILTYNPDDSTWNGYDSEWGDFTRNDIQYWMPLPELPESEGE